MCADYADFNLPFCQDFSVLVTQNFPALARQREKPVRPCKLIRRLRHPKLYISRQNRNDSRRPKMQRHLLTTALAMSLALSVAAAQTPGGSTGTPAPGAQTGTPGTSSTTSTTNTTSTTSAVSETTSSNSATTPCVPNGNAPIVTSPSTTSPNSTTSPSTTTSPGSTTPPPNPTNSPATTSPNSTTSPATTPPNSTTSPGATSSGSRPPLR